ncbi:MAG: hypothetical protein U9N40_05995 [Euryarchaeota archaeon]|nr:hypothetical protein [Euryarchaeota archaeon]
MSLHAGGGAIPTGLRSLLNSEDMLEWSNPKQLERYRKFAREQKIPVFIVIGLEEWGEDEYEEECADEYPELLMFNIPLESANYPKLYPGVFEKYERPYEKPFFWRNGVLK